MFGKCNWVILRLPRLFQWQCSHFTFFYDKNFKGFYVYTNSYLQCFSYFRYSILVICVYDDVLFGDFGQIWRAILVMCVFGYFRMTLDDKFDFMLVLSKFYVRILVFLILVMCNCKIGSKEPCILKMKFYERNYLYLDDFYSII